MNEKDTSKNTAGRGLKKIVVRTLNLLWVTCLVSVIYMGIIKAGVFELLEEESLQRIAVCAIELLVLAAYWYFVYGFSRKCRHRTGTLKKYYRRTCIVFAAFSAVYFLAYCFIPREMFIWAFRITLNLNCIRPDDVNLLPYMLLWLVITFLIMLLEPAITRRIAKRQREKGDRWK